jgi:hypothetical protein
MSTNASDNEIRTAADEMVERLGKTAVTVARERAERVRENGDHRGYDVALRLLTAVENRVEGQGGSK